jgi:hypothetical protein
MAVIGGRLPDQNIAGGLTGELVLSLKRQCATQRTA